MSNTASFQTYVWMPSRKFPTYDSFKNFMEFAVYSDETISKACAQIGLNPSSFRNHAEEAVRLGIISQGQLDYKTLKGKITGAKTSCRPPDKVCEIRPIKSEIEYRVPNNFKNDIFYDNEFDRKIEVYPSQIPGEISYGLAKVDETPGTNNSSFYSCNFFTNGEPGNTIYKLNNDVLGYLKTEEHYILDRIR